MPIDPAVIADAGGWAAFVALVMAIGIGVVKGWWVPGFVYRRELARGDSMTAELRKNTEALKKLAAKLTGKPVAQLGGDRAGAD